MQPPPDHAFAPAPPNVFGDAVRATFDLSPSPMALLDVSGRIVRTNFRIAALLGTPPEGLLGRHWSDFAEPADRAAADRALADLVDGRRAILEAAEFEFIRPDGQLASFRSSTSAVIEPGEPPLLLVQLTDLGEERRASRALAELAEQHDHVAAVLASSRQALLATDVRGILTTWNDAMAEMLGWKAEEVIGRPLAALFPGGGKQAQDLVDEVVGGILIPRFASFFPRKDGEHIAVDCDAGPVYDTEGDVIGFSCVFQMHDPEAPDARLRWVNTQVRLLSRLRALIVAGGTPDEVEGAVLTAVASTTFSTHVLIVDVREDGRSMNMRAQLGWEPGVLTSVLQIDETTLMGSALSSGSLLTEDDLENSKYTWRNDNGVLAINAGLAIPVTRDGKVIAGISAYRATGGWAEEDFEYVREIASMYADALTRWEQDAEQRRTELHDRLTGLPTLTLLTDRLEQALERDRADGVLTAVIVLDVDHFKRINETVGHDIGDRLLQAVVPRLRAVAGPGDTVGRLSGDEFVVVLGELETEAEAMHRAEALLEAFVDPFAAAGEEHLLTVSMGLTLAEDGASAQQLLSDADAAAFRAKELGRNRIEVFDRTLRERVTERVKTERELRGAVDREELTLRYQPIVDLRTGFLEGVEALARWQHPERGLVGPGDFIEIAEESGLIVGLGDWVLHTACHQAAQWLEEHELPRPFKLSVNLSARQLANRGLGDSVVRALESSGLPRGALGLEVTESVLLQPDAIDVLTELRTYGVRIMLDDFGTGYSSLSYLRQFEVDALKIDRSFVSELGERRRDALLVSALVQMAGALNIDAVAEGVETAQQAQMLRVLGCGLAQGFHFARPLTIEDATALMRAGGVTAGGRST
ncbi:MAG: EAL domain-containing protein [Solirubrobacteraceae bacterium]|nr:EAL domain-containing protein [Solirubrobacteraceae bacterium]